MESSNSNKKLLTTYLRRLTNLSGKNRALFLPRLLGDQFIDVHSFNQLNREKSFAIIEALIARKNKRICAVLDSRFSPVNEVSKKLKRLQRLDKFIFEERGSRDLHVGWPFVRGKFNDGSCIRCPILFFPVELIVEDNNWILKQREGEIVFNKSFLLAYSFYNKVKLADSLIEQDVESVDPDSTVFRTALYKMLQEAQLEINFNPDNFRDELISFESFQKQEVESTFNDGELKLFPESVLGIFPQAGSYLVPDYHKLIENEASFDLEEFFFKRSSKQELNSHSNFINKIKEEKVYPAFPMDIWQENALKAVKFGNSIVVEGPPGTGKSHLICNLVADAIANKQRVLVVCQKRVALDVVSNRLHEKGLSPFLALVHDFKEDRKDVYDRLRNQIENIEEFKQKNNSIDAIQLERKFYILSRRIDQLTEELDEFRTALFTRVECGLSARELYLQSSFTEPYVNLKQDFFNYRFDELDPFLDKLKIYAHYADRFLDEYYEWKERKSFSQFTQNDFETIKLYLAEIPKTLLAVETMLKEVLNTEISWDTVVEFANHSAAANELLELISSAHHYQLFKQIADESDEEVNALWLSNMERVVSDCFNDVGPEITVDTANLGHFQQVLHESQKSRKSIFGLIRWELFSKQKVLMARVLIANKVKNDKAGLSVMERKLDKRLNLEHNLSKLKSKAWLTDIPETYSLTDYRHWFQLQQRIIHAKRIVGSIRSLSTFISPKHLSHQEFTSRIKSLFGEADRLFVKKAMWSIYLTEYQIQLFAESSLTQHFERILKRDFNSLVEFDTQQQALSQTELGVIKRLHGGSKSWNFEHLRSILLNSLSLHWIEYLEVKYPILKDVSSGKIQLFENELRNTLSEKLKISNEILLLRARENVIEELEFNRLNNRITYRDVLHQTTKKKKIWPLRKLIDEHSDELFKLLPCWLASPETVSAIFPMEEIFDLVIFDEASQCFVERGIPAMYRGKQLVIAGDSQQLKPSDLYQARWQQEEELQPDLEIDSLLDLAKRYLLQTDLRHHYRSQSPALMEFSNQHFYRGKLTLLPDRVVANDKRSPIEYHLVNGEWIDQTNQIEANYVVSLLNSLAKDEPQLSVGVITFNAPQQNLIQDLFESNYAETKVINAARIFIKNIENVQGDESDVIIFSIGYAANKYGKVAMQFGSLSQQGGENRLNVAITRAKKRIIIVASILPDQLHVQDTANEGPTLFKSYLKYAYEVSKGMPSIVGSGFINDKLSLKKVITDWCAVHNPQVNLTSIHTADIAIKLNDLFEGLLFTDDEQYSHGLSAKDRHALLPTVMETKNWKFTHLYSRNYWLDKETFFNETGKFITNS
jgi:hypothetical protein